MRLKETLTPIAIAGALFAAGCGREHSPKVKAVTTPEQEQTQPQDNAASSDPSIKALQESMKIYRERVAKRHRAQVLLGSCVAWENSTGITVTLNPGILLTKTGELYYIFSAYDEHYQPPIIQMDGPQVVNAMTLAFKPKNHTTGGSDRKLSHNAVHDNNDQIYYEDQQSGEPVMNTALDRGPLTESNVAEICNDLRQHTPLHENLIA